MQTLKTWENAPLHVVIVPVANMVQKSLHMGHTDAMLVLQSAASSNNGCRKDPVRWSMNWVHGVIGVYAQQHVALDIQ